MISIDHGVFVSLLLAHLLGDFVLQTKQVLEWKKMAWGQALHAAIHAGLTFATLVGIYAASGQMPSIWHLLIYVGVIALTHMVLDSVKTFGSKQYRESWWGYLGDQVLHVGVLVAIAAVAPNSNYSSSVHTLVVLAAASIATTRMGQFFVGATLRLIPVPIPRPDEDGKIAEDTGTAGRVIGNLERFLIMVLVWTGLGAGVTLIVAAKSIARWNELKHKDFAEYYLVGTLTSVTWAIVVTMGFHLLK